MQNVFTRGLRDWFLRPATLNLSNVFPANVFLLYKVIVLEVKNNNFKQKSRQYAEDILVMLVSYVVDSILKFKL